MEGLGIFFLLVGLFTGIMFGVINMAAWLVTVKIFQKKFKIQAGVIVLIRLITTILCILLHSILLYSNSYGDFAFVFFGLKIFMETIIVKYKGKLLWKKTMMSVLVSNLCLVVISGVVIGIHALLYA